MQGTAVLRGFIAMQLDVVQTETVGIHKDAFLAFIDKDTDALGISGQVPGYFAQAAGRFGIENESYHIYALLFYLADIFCFSHSAYFNERSHGVSD